jgi:hypothetical protein
VRMRQDFLVCGPDRCRTDRSGDMPDT